MTSRNVSMPASRPWSITTSEPMSFSAIALTASRTDPSGVTVNSVLPLMRRISLTSMAPPSAERGGRPPRRLARLLSRDGGTQWRTGYL